MAQDDRFWRTAARATGYSLGVLASLACLVLGLALITKRRSIARFVIAAHSNPR